MRRDRQSMQSGASRAIALILALMLLPSVVHGQQECRVYQRSDFPFIQALHELDSEERKLEHLRSWTRTMGAENGLSDVYARAYGTLLALFLLRHVGDDEALDRESLIDDIRDSFSLSDWITMNDEGHVAERIPEAGYFPAYAMFVFSLDSLIPNFFDRLRPPRTRSECPNAMPAALASSSRKPVSSRTPARKVTR